MGVLSKVARRVGFLILCNNERQFEAVLSMSLMRLLNGKMPMNRVRDCAYVIRRVAEAPEKIHYGASYSYVFNCVHRTPSTLFNQPLPRTLDHILR